jgi:hypothetical protein
MADHYPWKVSQPWQAVQIGKNRQAPEFKQKQAQKAGALRRAKGALPYRFVEKTARQRVTLFRRVIFTPFAGSQLYSANTCTLGNLSQTSQIPKLPLRFAPRNEAPFSGKYGWNSLFSESFGCVTPNWAKVATCQLSLAIAAICTDRANFLLPTSRYCQHMDLPKTVTMPSFLIFYSVVLHPKNLPNCGW